MKHTGIQHFWSHMKNAGQALSASQRPWGLLSSIAYQLLGLYVLFLVLFGLLALWVHIHPILPLDVWITREFQENPSPLLRTTMLAVSALGIPWVLWPLILIAAVLFWIGGLHLEAVCLVALSGVSALLNVALKLLVGRPRPTGNLIHVFVVASGKSFPSGHVMAYVAFWGLLFSFSLLLFSGRHWWRSLLIVVCVLLVMLIGPARIYLGDHWATDVLGSYLIGLALLGITLWVYLELKRRGVLEPKSANKSPLRPKKRWSWMRK
jgi:membrane-associated phospholipid phosphatase